MSLGTSLYKTDLRRWYREKALRWRKKNPARWKEIHDKANRKWMAKQKQLSK